MLDAPRRGVKQAAARGAGTSQRVTRGRPSPDDAAGGKDRSVAGDRRAGAGFRGR